MTVKLFQTRRYPPPVGTVDKVPVFAGDPECWLGAGTYFWESFVDNAIKWGKTHYSNSYKISQKNYTYTKQNCLNLVDDVDDLLMLKKLYECIKRKNSNALPKYLYSFLKLVRKGSESAKRYECARLLPYGCLRPMLKLECSKDATFKGEFYFTPPIQVCFWNRVNVDIEDIDEENSANNV